MFKASKELIQSIILAALFGGPMFAYFLLVIKP
jgi:hypothetical protein